MASDYIPSPDLDAASWFNNFATKITANPTLYGLVAGDATAIQTAADDFDDALTLSNDPATRTPATVAAKDTQRATTEGVIRPYAMQINADSSVSDGSRIALGLTVRKTTTTPAAAPTDTPLLSLRSQVNASVTFEIRATATPTTRARPEGVDGAQLVLEEEVAASPGTYSFVDSVNVYGVPAVIELAGGSGGKNFRMRTRWFNNAKTDQVSLFGPWSQYLPLVSTAQ